MIQKTNVDDVFLRNAMVAIIDLFYQKIKTRQVNADGVEEERALTVYTRKDDDAQFMADYFIEYSSKCKGKARVEGDFDLYPQMIINLPKVSVLTGNMTNKFVRGTVIVDELDKNGYKVDNEYSMMLYALPINLSISCEVDTNTVNQSFRIIEDVWNCVYQNTSVYFNYRNQRIKMGISFKESPTLDKKQDFNFSTIDSDKQKIKFEIEAETYFPVFDKSTSIWMGDIVKSFRIFVSERETKTKIYEKNIDENYGVE